MRVCQKTAWLIFAVLICCGCGSSTDKKPSVPSPEEGSHIHKPVSATDSLNFVSRSIKVSGDVENELLLTVDSLKKMNVITLDEFNVVCQSGATRKTDKTSKGVLLRDILEKAGIKQTNHKDRDFIFIARAADDYKAIFSWAEIFNNSTGENTYVLFEENEQPIIMQGETILICANDIKTGPRHVIWLKSIDVKRIV